MTHGGLDVCLVHAWDAGKRRTQGRIWGLVDTLADQRRWAVLGLFVCCEILACLVCAARARYGYVVPSSGGRLLTTRQR